MSRARALARVPRPRLDFSQYPDVMRKAHLAVIFGRSERWIELQVRAGTFPIPRLARVRTPAWSKARVQQFFTAETYAPVERSA